MQKIGKPLFLFATSCCLAAQGHFATADTCSQLDPKPGLELVKLDDDNNHLKAIFVSQVVGIDFTDQDEINDSMIDAEMKAKRKLAAFMKEKLSSEYINKEVISKQKIQEGDSKKVVKETVKTQIRDIKSNVEKELVGVKAVDTCVDVGDLKRVGVTIVWSAKLAEVATDASVKMTQEAARQDAAASKPRASKSSGSDAQKSSFSSTRKKEKGLY